jgi:hypothetical protein
MKTMKSRRLCERQILLTALTLLLVLLSTGYVSASETPKRFSIFLAGGRSYPLVQFADLAKISGNWGAGAELRFGSNLAIGIVVHAVEFKHLRPSFDHWSGQLRYNDWSFVRGNWYGKYSLRRRGISPFVKAGVGVYSMKNRCTLVGESPTESQITGCSIAPGLGLEYCTKRILFFTEADFNIVNRSTAGGTGSHQAAPFFDLLLGVGFFISNL